MDTTYESPNESPAFDFQKEREKYNRLISDFECEKGKVSERRKIRENRRNVEEERAKGAILEDETIIPDRTVNTNIRVGRGPYLTYVTQCKRLLIITEIDQPKIPVASLEEWFTRGMRYPKWKLPWIKLVDCMHTHGGGALEVMYDPEKPLNVTIEYIGRDSLLFHKKCTDIQGQPHILRAYELTTLQLEEYSAKLGFDESVVKELLDKRAKSDDPLCVYKGFCKKQGIVYNYWYSKDTDKTWLREPQIHDIGLFNFDPNLLMQPSILDGMPLFQSQEWEAEVVPGQPPLKKLFAQPLQLRQYPIIWFPYEVTENEYLYESQGRVALDLHVQEAQTHLLTNTVNATRRAATFYPCAKNDPTQDQGTLELAPLKPGVVYPRELATFQPQWPNNIILAVMQAMKVDKANEAGHSDFAAMARKDANKTATEMELATEQANMNKGSDMDIYSSPVLDTLALCFEVARHQAIFGLCHKPTRPELLLGTFNLQPAGDVEVVKREETKANAKEFFNIVQGTPLAEKILVLLIESYFPDQADEWILALSGPNKDAIIQELVNVLQGLLKDIGNELSPDQQSALINVIAAAQSVVGAGDDTTAAQNSSPQQGAPTEDSAPNPTNPQ